jgi:hypothetical protein
VDADVRTVWEKIEQGAYRNLKPFPNPAMRKTDPELHRSMWNSYHAGEQEARARFWTDVEEEYGTKGSLLWAPLRELAWERGHSSGYYEVLTMYADLVDKLQPDLVKLSKSLADTERELAQCRAELAECRSELLHYKTKEEMK